MPPKARIDPPDALRHMIVRGIERRKIFRSDYDRKNLLDRVSELILQTGIECFAWAFMSNHFHLLLRTGSVPIAVLMRRLLTGYAGWFNYVLSLFLEKNRVGSQKLSGIYRKRGGSRKAIRSDRWWIVKKRWWVGRTKGARI
jgi:REP element-mobilizing transposase RayT